ncbi:RtcB family protein [Chelatococcus asaccharovorans]|uniref:3'-phosphate/5'-hydroxy nucleic acid ligase n=1 Tax=Chelatococcus asaccharovorans TaxID=28210 RepID=A0A2V3UAS3_9HYPH|nr:RtcB family protein [Chelatococcus asaccharovorans]MBS7703255.1 RtcB family protein [Chelatococcus asaccharovorans]PXW61585.1 RNA-splicing ligase RtcB [Chelatococcus asaccharovorans]
MTTPITGATLIAWGFKPGEYFKAAIDRAKQMRAGGANDDAIFSDIQSLVPVTTLMRTNAIDYGVFLDADTEAERANAADVVAHMDALMRVPTIVSGAVMPDACPSGMQEGTIPVGGAVACKDAIHPGFHSADICCSVAMTLFKRGDDPKVVLDAMQAVTHFGPGGRKDMLQLPREFAEAFDNPFLRGLENMALGHFGSQGDGNHFAYVGRLASTGQIALVTHHGSRGFGAQLYKRGMAVAKKHTAITAPKVPSHNAWIKASSADGEAYWSALQWVRRWTKASHFALHDLVAKRIGNAVVDRFWNEHNFVFQKSDGLFYHGKGATPSWAGFSEDDDGRTLIPLNMAEPILIVSHRDRKEALGFAPHGAGRNMGRKAFLRDNTPEIPAGIDARFYCGIPDLSELPAAYKNAASVRAQIEKYRLADVSDVIEPYGCIMAGDWEQQAPWRNKGGKEKR